MINYERAERLSLEKQIMEAEEEIRKLKFVDEFLRGSLTSRSNFVFENVSKVSNAGITWKSPSKNTIQVA